MKISSKLRHVVVAIIAIVMILDNVPTAEGLSCYLCFGPNSKQVEDRAEVIESKWDEAEHTVKWRNSVLCKDFDAASKKEARNKAECPESFHIPFCIAHSTIGSMCGNAETNIGITPKMNSCQEDLCICDKDFCNKANDMNDSSKRVVIVALLGVSYLVRRYFDSF